MSNDPVPCPSCGTPTKAYDTEPWKNELTYAYECQCGNTWTDDVWTGDPAEAKTG